MKRRNPTCWDCGERISWDEATATQQRLNGKVITVYVCPGCVREALAAFRNPIRHTRRGWFWGSRGPFPTREKAGQVARAAHAHGYRGRNPQVKCAHCGTIFSVSGIGFVKCPKCGKPWIGRGKFRRKNPKGYGKTLRGAVMRLASRYRKRGMSRGEAMSRAWQSKGQIREYMIANPNKWKPKTNWLFIALIAGGIGYWIWRSRKKEVSNVSHNSDL